MVTEEDLDKLTLKINSNDDLQQALNEAESIDADELNDVNNNLSVDELRNLDEAVGMETPEICITCQKNVCDDDQSYRCQTCSMPIHLSCSRENGLCDLCITAETISSNQIQSYHGITVQAEKMLTVTRKILPDISVGDCVLVNVNKVDRSPGDPQNIIAVITDFKNGVYQVGSVTGLIKSWFSKSDLKKASSTFIKIDQVNQSTFISLREAVAALLLFNGQGFVKCSCQPSKTQCKTNRCLCFKSKQLCNSRCHKSRPCANK